ncbi:DUF2505 domain-containing protein [Solimonas terrae]|uniref:DUF2505 domain-containing protein n=1 Tax=Solimonas terrae TaxID=1396819 RepID=A0A6M2BSD4_9GAMM|nr:DUF2505 domain-containing protein [Solimonas terrae]NGY04907.1 DUF2505 domain-containing protein [Solimonas terrae]
MKHEIKARYPASPDIVMKMFADKAFHTRKLEMLGMPYKVLAQSGNARQFSIRIERKVPVQMPGVGKKAETTIVNEEVWNLADKTGVVKVDAGVMPLDCSCTTAITADGAAAIVTYRWEVKSSVPLLGGKIEKMAIADMESRSDDETRVAIELLKDYR